MKAINIKIVSAIIILIIASCGGGEDKKTQLENLKKQQAEIAEQIKQLEAELLTDTTQTATPQANAKTVNVIAEELKNETFNHYIEVQGKLDGEENLAVFPEGMGSIIAVNVKVGQNVKKGQVLARMDNAAQLEQLKALETNFNLVKDAYERQERLWNQKIGSEMQYLQAKANKEALESQISGTRKQINMLTITAPIDGVIGEVLLKIGQTASPQFPAFRLVSFKSIKVVADVAESYASKISENDNVIIYFPDLNKEVTANVSAVSKYISPVNRTFLVEVRLSSALPDFKANMIAVLKINDYSAKKSISIPLNILQNDLTEDFVFTAIENNGSKFAKRTVVKKGIAYDGKIEILSGLKAGDKIITVGFQSVEDSTLINY